ncbi:GNAT family N-acetyltransferase [Halobacteriovorax sp. ZH4_bin.1]|uniref:GNAT family N-acetyltransferase n=1 Tax=unclassified Halobacteriovorax TaxID=2639665 RepID=UPI00371C0B57
MNHYEYKEYSQISDEVFEIVSQTNSQIFSTPYSVDRMYSKTKDCTKFLAQFYFDGSQPIAFKVGYDCGDYFYSWVGGVVPFYRGQKLATKLMQRQHEWAKGEGFSKVRTHTDARYPEMIELNEKFGFKLVDTRMKENQIEQLILEKNLFE